MELGEVAHDGGHISPQVDRVDDVRNEAVESFGRFAALNPTGGEKVKAMAVEQLPQLEDKLQEQLNLAPALDRALYSDD
jgi:hypothetical protein